MGYTRYWNQTGKKITQKLVDRVNRIIKDCENKGIHLGDGTGNNEPIVTMDKIVFNGNADKGLDHESFVIANGLTGFNFCKTARKPYDYAVRQALIAAASEGVIDDVSSDGSNTTIISDAAWLGEEEPEPKKIPVIVRYSFDRDTPIWLFDTEEEACAEIKKQFDEELRIDTEETGHVIGEDMEIELAGDNSYAKITIWFDGEENITEWFVGDIRN